MTAVLDYESIAAQIHEFYRTKYGGMPPYDQLPEFMKADNREAALRIGQVLSIAGLRIEPRDTAEWPQDEQQAISRVIEDHLELLAEAEHRGWMEARLRHGWVAAEQVNRERKESHLLVPFADFPRVIERKRTVAGAEKYKSGPQAGQAMTLEKEIDHEKNKDRDSVRNYVGMIARTPYRIVAEH
ncbi:MAG: RyR domain-containing protein [Planctomycetota bacterium]